MKLSLQSGLSGPHVETEFANRRNYKWMMRILEKFIGNIFSSLSFLLLQTLQHYVGHVWLGTSCNLGKVKTKRKTKMKAEKSYFRFKNLISDFRTNDIANCITQIVLHKLYYKL